MIDFIRAIELIRRNGGFKSNSNDSSYYRTYTIEGNRPLQARISNHGTWLWTWYDKQYDPSYAINTCVVYSENGEDNSNIEVDMRIVDKDGNVIGEKKPFEVTQYVYNCQLLDENDSILINQAVQNIWQNKGYKDPLANTPKHARVMILRPNEEPEIITENKTRYNMNKLIRLTESDLHRIVKESVQRILKETRLDYDEDNFSGRYSRNADNTIPYQGKLFAFDVDDRGKIYKYGQQPIDVISQCESEAERYGQGHCSVETYESEEDYINAIRNYIKKGYVVTN